MYSTSAACGGVLIMLLVICILSGAETNTTVHVNNCVCDYEEFEEKTFSNKGNRYKLYDLFYPPNGHLPYAVEVTYQAVLPNGTEYNITIS